MVKDLTFDLFLPKIKAQTQKKVFQVLADETAFLCGVEQTTLNKIFTRRLSERTFGMGRGVAIFDVKSSQIKRSLLVMATLDQKINFNALDDAPVNIVAALISPSFEGPLHLQKLAQLSRLIKDENLCADMRNSDNADDMRILLSSDLYKNAA